MSRYLLLLGSNAEAEQRLGQALTLLVGPVQVLAHGEPVRSADRQAVLSGAAAQVPSYLNQGVEIVTSLDAAELKAWLRVLEARCGRTRPASSPGICPLDADIALLWEEGAWRWLDQEAQRQDYARQALSRWLDC